MTKIKALINGQVKRGDNLLGIAKPESNFSSRTSVSWIEIQREESQETRKKFYLGNPRYPYSTGKRNVRCLPDKVSRRCQYQMSKLSTIFWMIPVAMRRPPDP